MAEKIEQVKQHSANLRYQSRQSTDAIDDINQAAWELRFVDAELAANLSQEALRFSNENDYLRGRAYALRTYGYCQILTDRYKEAEQNLKESRNIFEILSNDISASEEKASYVSTINALGIVHRATGNYDEALDNQILSLNLYNQLNDSVKVATVHNSLGTIYKQKGDYQATLEYFYQALEMALGLDNNQLELLADINLGDALWRIGESEQAVEYSQQAIELSKECGTPREQSVSIINLGAAQQSRGEYQTALDNYQRGLQLARDAQSIEVEAEALMRMGSIYLELPVDDEAFICLNQALELTQIIGNRYYESETLVNLGAAYLQVGDFKKSEATLQEALESSQKVGNKELCYRTHLVLSDVYERQDKLSAALAHHRQFHHLWHEIHGATAARQLRQVLIKSKVTAKNSVEKWQHSVKNVVPEKVKDIFGKQPKQAVLPPRRLQQIVQHINHRLEHRITVTELAEIAGLNERYFIEIFKHSTGITPHQFLIEKRVGHAQLLLKTTSLPLHEIALQCGFNSQSHLSTQFRLLTGQTPRQYRQS